MLQVILDRLAREKGITRMGGKDGAVVEETSESGGAG